MAEQLGCTESQALEGTRHLCEVGIIRRIGPIVNARALGRTNTLVMAHVPESHLHKVTEVVNSLAGVSHNYLRSHYYNLWFTLQGSSLNEIQEVLSHLADQLDVEFHSLPAKRVFKLEVFFDATGREPSPHEPPEVPSTDPVELTPMEWKILSDLQQSLQIDPQPFDKFGDEGIKTIEILISKGVIRRIAAVVNHRILGYTANSLLVAEVPEDCIAAYGMSLASLPQVSHCYQREGFPGWPYSLYAMIHGQSIDEIHQIVEDLQQSQNAGSTLLLDTVEELKKQPVMYA
jgi:DNA-binding Lrp family transcriptional regulator